MTTDDVGLARRAAAGDRSAFEELYNQKFRLVWSIARGRLGDEAAAEEVVQDTFIQAHRKLTDFRGPNLNSWLCEICKNLCFERQKRQGRREELAPMVPLEDYSGVEDGADRVIDRDLIRNALENLPSDQCDAFVKVRIFGYEAKEVAAQRGVPASTVRSQVSAATQRLLEILKAAYEVDHELIGYKRHPADEDAASPVQPDETALQPLVGEDLDRASVDEQEQS
jgi:RNA polymerase sigma factor (sigma-70 family)